MIDVGIMWPNALRPSRKPQAHVPCFPVRRGLHGGKFTQMQRLQWVVCVLGHPRGQEAGFCIKLWLKNHSHRWKTRGRLLNMCCMCDATITHIYSNNVKCYKSFYSSECTMNLINNVYWTFNPMSIKELVQVFALRLTFKRFRCAVETKTEKQYRNHNNII